MREVVENLFWIGNVGDVADMAAVYDAGIEALIDLAENEKPLQLTRDMIYCRFPLNDGGGNSPKRLGAAIHTVQFLIAKQMPTLVYCSAGMSRSVAIAAAALARHRESSLDEVLLQLVSGRPHDVSPVLWNDICEVCAGKSER